MGLQKGPRFDAERLSHYARFVRNAAAAALVFVGGFILMVLEVIGARFLVPTPAAVEAMLNGESTGPILDQEYEVVENLLQDGIRYVRAEARQGDRRIISALPE